MRRILMRKVWRELRQSFLRYLALSLMIFLSIYLVVSLIGAADTVIIGGAAHAEANRVEDGQFSCFVPLTDRELEELESHGLEIEAMFFRDYTLADGSVLRVFRVRRSIDLAELACGAYPGNDRTLLLEKRYSEVKGLTAGSALEIAGLRLTVSGVVTTPDYDAPFRTMGESTVDSANFGTAFVPDGLYERLAATGRRLQSEEYLYAYRLHGAMSDDELRELLKTFMLEADAVEDPFFQDYWEQTFGKRDDLIEGARDLADGNHELAVVFQELQDKLDGNDYPLLSSYIPQETRDDLTELIDGVKELDDGSAELRDAIEEIADSYLEPDISKLRSFTPAADNPRIGAAADDVIINKYASLAAGVIIMVMLTYVISVFVIHGIEREQSVIGTLYALGMRRADLLRHYLALPVTVCLFSAALGTVAGYSRFGVPLQTADTYAYYSVPTLKTELQLYLLLYGVAMPPLIAAIVNWIVIRRRLSAPALQMIRGEEKRRDISMPDLGELGYVRRFQLRQMLREGRSAVGVVLGIFICLLLMMIGIDAYVMCGHVASDNIADTRYAYMYLYKYPEEEAPEGGWPAYAETLKKEVLGYNLDVTVLGLAPGNPFFDAAPPESQSRVQISSAMAQKYALEPGDQLIVNDEQNDRAYAFTVDGVVTYAPAFFVFMDLDSMRELFGMPDDYYNMVFSDHDLHIDPGRLYSVSTRSDVVKAATVFTDLMYGMVYTMIVASAAIMGIVMFLMIKVMIDRSVQSIALFKIFGYRRRELNRLFLNGNTLLIAIGTMISIPLAKTIMDAMYPFLVSNVACAINLYFEPWIYAVLFAGVMLVYALIHIPLTRRIGRIRPNEVLKNRE